MEGNEVAPSTKMANLRGTLDLPVTITPSVTESNAEYPWYPPLLWLG